MCLTHNVHIFYIFKYLGAPLDPEVALAIADGEMDPNSRQRFDGEYAL